VHAINIKGTQMNLHEYQAKALLKKYGLPVQEGILATSPDEAVAAYKNWLENLQ
jgi:succinyl-CoA synthetase beta subunit